MPWSIVLSAIHDTEEAPGMRTVRNARVTANSLLTATFALTVTRVLAAALDELETYLVGPG